MSMNHEKKSQVIEKLKERLGKSSGIYFFDYQNISVNDQQILRQRLLENQSEYQVAKNTLVRIALKAQEVPELESILSQPTAVLFAYQDEIMPLKVLADFAKEHEAISIKGGLLNNEFYSGESVKRLAKLPSKLQLQARLVGAMASPISGFMRVASGPLAGFMRIVHIVSQKK